MKTVKDWIGIIKECHSDEELAEALMFVRRDIINTIHAMVVESMKFPKPDGCLLCGHTLISQMHTLVGQSSDDLCGSDERE